MVAFLGTTIDDLIILTAPFMARRTSGPPGAWTIIAGQYAGFVAIPAASLLAATGLQIVPDRWVGLLGRVPIGFGAWGSHRTVVAVLGRVSHGLVPVVISTRARSPTESSSLMELGQHVRGYGRGYAHRLRHEHRH